jgi:predicted tellurium resistance membrane protein TerC
MTAALIALVTLTLMEIVLGIDNVIFIAIVAGKLPANEQDKARKLGLTVALGTRLILLFFLTLLMSLDKYVAIDWTWFGIPESWFSEEAKTVTVKDLVILLGGLFLIAKSTMEIHHKLEGDDHATTETKAATFQMVIIQIALLDLVFSLDSVITAIGMVHPDHLWVMVTSMVLAMLVMLACAGPVSDFVARHPTVKILALAFLILIGVMLLAEGLGTHIPKGYIYFAMAFSVGVELLNMQLRKKSANPVVLHQPQMPAMETASKS